MFSHTLANFIVLGLSIVQATAQYDPVVIRSVQSPISSVQDHGAEGNVLFVVDYKGGEPVSIWDRQSSTEDAYTLKNTYYGHYAFDAADIVVGSNNKTGFAIESAGNNTFEIKLPDENKVWTLVGPHQGHYPVPHIHLEPATGKASQRWTLESVDG